MNATLPPGLTNGKGNHNLTKTIAALSLVPASPEFNRIVLNRFAHFRSGIGLERMRTLNHSTIRIKGIWLGNLANGIHYTLVLRTNFEPDPCINFTSLYSHKKSTLTCLFIPHRISGSRERQDLDSVHIALGIGLIILFRLIPPVKSSKVLVGENPRLITLSFPMKFILNQGETPLARNLEILRSFIYI